MSVDHSNSLKSSIIRLLSKTAVSLADLQAVTQVSMPTLRNTLQELSDSGWICPVGRSESTGGRPATLFGLNDQTHLIVGVHLEIPTLNLITATLGGQVVDRVRLADSEELLPEDAVKKISEYVQNIQTVYKNRKLLGIGLATPGYIDPASGQILLIRASHWRNFPLKARLEVELDLPVMIENDVDCMTFAELAHTKNLDAIDMLYLGFSEGVKVSLVLGGRLYKGPFGNAGVVGRTVTSKRGASETFEEYRYLEEIASVGSVCRTFDQQIAALPNLSSVLSQIATMTDHGEKFRAILNAAETEPVCKEIVTGVLNTLAEEVSKLIYILQPSLLIIGGALSYLPVSLRGDMENNIRENLPSLISSHLLIKYANMTGSRVAAVGAAHRFLQQYNLEES